MSSHPIPAHSAKIAVVIPKYGLIGGAEEFAAQTTERIAENPRYEVHVFANRWQSRSSRIFFHKIPVISFPKFLTTLSFASFANRKIARLNFDLVHTHERVLEADLFTMHGIPHRFWVKEIRRKRMSLFDRVTERVEKALVQNNRCRGFWAVSQLARGVFLREYPQIDPARVQILCPGVDTGRFGFSDREGSRREMRGKLGLPPEEFVILFVSMNFEIKGLAELLAGLAELNSRPGGARFRLLVIGKGNVPKFMNLARQSGLSEKVLFLGAVPKEKLTHFYLAADAFALLSKFDTFGITVLEAMAASLPVIVSKNVGAKDLVEEGGNGYVLADPSRAEEVAARFALLMDVGRRHRMAAAARLAASNRSWETVAEKVQRIYEDLLAGGG